MPNVSVEAFIGLTVDFVKQCQADVILRGIRSSSDLQFEFQVALTNRVVASVETVFIMTKPEFAFTSSNLIKQMASMGSRRIRLGAADSTGPHQTTYSAAG